MNQKSSVLKLDADKKGYLAPTQIQVETSNMLLKQIHILFVSHTHTLVTTKLHKVLLYELLLR